MKALDLKDGVAPRTEERTETTAQGRPEHFPQRILPGQLLRHGESAGPGIFNEHGYGLWPGKYAVIESEKEGEFLNDNILLPDLVEFSQRFDLPEFRYEGQDAAFRWNYNLLLHACQEVVPVWIGPDESIDINGTVPGNFPEIVLPLYGGNGETHIFE